MSDSLEPQPLSRSAQPADCLRRSATVDMAKAPTAGRAGGLLLLAVGLASQLGPGLCEICECSADACTKDTLHFMTSVYINNENSPEVPKPRNEWQDTSTPCAVGADGVLDHDIDVRAGAPRRRPPARHAAQQPCRSARSRCEARVASQPRTMQVASQRQGAEGGVAAQGGRSQFHAPGLAARPDPATPRRRRSTTKTRSRPWIWRA